MKLVQHKDGRWGKRVSTYIEKGRTFYDVVTVEGRKDIWHVGSIVASVQSNLPSWP